MNNTLEKNLKNKIAFYCRLSCEIENKPESELDKINKRLKEKFKEISNYKPYHGFYDLRCFKLNNHDFKDLWIMQDLLYYCESNKELLKNKIPDLYVALKDLSATYQQDLLSHEVEEEIEK